METLSGKLRTLDGEAFRPEKRSSATAGCRQDWDAWVAVYAGDQQAVEDGLFVARRADR